MITDNVDCPLRVSDVTYLIVDIII